MTTRQRLDHPDQITGRDHGTPRVGRSPVTVEDLDAAWTKSVLLHMTAWTRPYVVDTDC